MRTLDYLIKLLPTRPVFAHCDIPLGDIVVIKVNGKEMVKRVQKSSDRGTFVTGDNSQESTDSRQFGPILLHQIVGKVIYQSAEIS